MRRTLFGFGLFVMSAGVVMLGAALYLRLLTDTLTHVLGGVTGLGAVLAALMADPKPFLAILDRVLQWKRGTP